MAGLAILKHTFNLSDEELCARWVENRISSSSAARPSSGMICLSTVLDDRWRQRMGEERIISLLQESLSWR